MPIVASSNRRGSRTTSGHATSSTTERQRVVLSVANPGGRIYSGVLGLACGRGHGGRCSADHGPRDWTSRAPTRIRSDNGSEFICAVLVDWLPGEGAKSIPVAAASPWENGYIEAFHSRSRRVPGEGGIRDGSGRSGEGKWFRRYYNAVRPHSSLDYATPKEFSSSCDDRRTGH